MEPPVFDRDLVMILERDEPWNAPRLRALGDSIRKRLSALSNRLGDADWLDGAFSAGDLLMVTVLRRLNGSGMLEETPNLAAYVARGEARPAFKRAFDAQKAVFEGKSAAVMDVRFAVEAASLGFVTSSRSFDFQSSPQCGPRPFEACGLSLTRSGTSTRRERRLSH